MNRWSSTGAGSRDQSSAATWAGVRRPSRSRSTSKGSAVSVIGSSVGVPSGGGVGPEVDGDGGRGVDAGDQQPGQVRDRGVVAGARPVERVADVVLVGHRVDRGRPQAEPGHQLLEPGRGRRPGGQQHIGGDVGALGHLRRGLGGRRRAGEPAGHRILDRARQVGQDVVHRPAGAGRDRPVPAGRVGPGQHGGQPLPAPPVVVADRRRVVHAPTVRRRPPGRPRRAR